MARTRVKTRYSRLPRWLDRCSQFPRHSIEDMKIYIKKLLIYYPKRVTSLAPLTREIYHELSTSFEQEKLLFSLYKRILLRYKTELLRYFDVNVSCYDLPLWRKGNGALSIGVCKNRYLLRSIMKPHISFRKSIKHNKHLKVFELDGNVPDSLPIFNQLRYIPALKWLLIKDIDFPYLLEHKQSFLSSKHSLSNVTLTIRSENFEEEKTGYNSAAQLLRMILEFPCLQRFNLFQKTEEKFNVNSIPFNILNKRNVTYFIFTHHKGHEFKFSPHNEIALGELQLLGLHFKDLWLSEGERWDLYEEELTRIRESSHKALLLNLFHMKEVDLSRLFTTCRNITTLEITLSYRNYTSGISFKTLKYLKNLKHIFIELASIQKRVYEGFVDGKPVFKEDKACCGEDLFRSLTSCCHTLESVNLHLYGQILTEDEEEVLAFFKACADVLAQIKLKFTYEPNVASKGLNVFIKGLGFLKRVKSMAIIYNNFDQDAKIGSEFGELKKIFYNKDFLRAFHLSASSISSGDILIDYEKLHNITNLEFDFNRLDMKTNFVKAMVGLQNLEEFKLSIRASDSGIWDKLVKMLNELKKLQVLFLHVDGRTTDNLTKDVDEENEFKRLIEELKVFFRGHTSLRFLAFGAWEDPEIIQIFKKRDSSEAPSSKEVDSFFGRYMEDLPKKRVQKVLIV